MSGLVMCPRFTSASDPMGNSAGRGPFGLLPYAPSNAGANLSEACLSAVRQFQGWPKPPRRPNPFLSAPSHAVVISDTVFGSGGLEKERESERLYRFTCSFAGGRSPDGCSQGRSTFAA